jgi:transcriptional regulator
MARPTNDILGGTLDLLILKALSRGRTHGYGVARWIEDATSDLLAVGESTLYPALHRLEERQLIDSEWGVSENNRRAKYYRLTARGRRQLDTDAVVWRRYAGAVIAALSTGTRPVA